MLDLLCWESITVSTYLDSQTEITVKTETDRFQTDLERVKEARNEFANYLTQIAEKLIQSEVESEKISGSFGFDRDIKDLNTAAEHLRNGVFRLLVLGDMKRGKSTFLNVLIGERILPTDVNPCTAILTIIRYGKEKKVTVKFNNGKPQESLSFENFTQRYTIPPDEAKKLKEEGKQAFPDVECAVVEYPLSILEKGVEFVDSPGLNDTETRNNITLGYIQNCHAILFVLLATQICTEGERRYLENYIKDRGLTVFFLINKWDDIRTHLFDPDDEQELRKAEENIRLVARTNLLSSCQVDDKNYYDRRVFEVDSLAALRARVKNKSLSATGFDKFLEALDNFLTEERIISELLQARILVRQAYQHVHQAVGLRLSLLTQSVKELAEKIKLVEPEFNTLVQIRENLRVEICQSRDRYADGIADSICAYLINLSDSFEEDFRPYQPQLNTVQLLNKNKREEFKNKLEESFKLYMNDKIAAWSKDAEQKLKQAFSELAVSAKNYGEFYTQVTEQISQTLIGGNIPNQTSHYFQEEDRSPGWTKWVAGALSLLSGNIGGVVLAGAGLSWRSIVVNFVATLGSVIAANIALTVFAGIVLGPIGVFLLSGIVGAAHLEKARRQIIKSAKETMVQQMPEIAKEKAREVYASIQECFNNFEKELMARINDDIESRQAELNNLLTQKDSKEIDVDAEIQRLNTLDNNIFEQWNLIETSYDRFMEKAAR